MDAPASSGTKPERVSPVDTPVLVLAIKDHRPKAKNGSARASRDQRSPAAGSNTNPASSGPRMQPTALTAYALPARSGFPRDHRSTSNGVMNPPTPQHGPIP